MYQLVVGSTTLQTAAAGGGGYTSLNDVVAALQLDGDYAGAPFIISDSNGAAAGGEIVITYKTGGPLRPNNFLYEGRRNGKISIIKLNKHWHR